MNPELWGRAVTPVQQRLLDTNDSKSPLNKTHPTQAFRRRTDFRSTNELTVYAAQLIKRQIPVNEITAMNKSRRIG